IAQSVYYESANQSHARCGWWNDPYERLRSDQRLQRARHGAGGKLVVYAAAGPHRHGDRPSHVLSQTELELSARLRPNPGGGLVFRDCGALRLSPRRYRCPEPEILQRTDCREIVVHLIRFHHECGGLELIGALNLSLASIAAHHHDRNAPELRVCFHRL